MAKRYIIDEIRANNWMVRMRDRETGEAVEVPLELGALWPGKLRGDAVPRDTSEPPVPQGDADAPSLAAETEEAPAEPRPKKERSARKSIARVTAPEELKEVMTSPTLRNIDVDEATISDEDADAFQKMQAMMRRARGRRAGKRGDLGWDETTDAGRSGIIARFGKGAFKILHAGGDTYALFYEWDDGRYDRLGCGAAEDLMNVANERARAEPPEPPPSHLSLELARLYCGTQAQKTSAYERLEPVLAETERTGIERVPPNPVTPATTDTDPADPIAPNAELDNRLTESLKRALADLDARETKEKNREA